MDAAFGVGNWDTDLLEVFIIANQQGLINNNQRFEMIQVVSNSANDDIFLPLSTRVHNGSHAKYDNLIQQRLDGINLNQSNQEIYQDIMDIINDVRTAVQDNPVIHVNSRPLKTI